MTDKPAKARVFKLDIFRLLRAIDQKDRAYFDKLTPEEVKEISPRVLVRWMTGIIDQGDPLEYEYRILMVNEHYNRNMYDINDRQHAKLKYFLATTTSLGNRTYRYEYIKHSKVAGEHSDPKFRKAVKFLSNIHPTLKVKDIELLARINSREDLKDLARQHGWTDAEIKSGL
jgi:hypothetical protein